MIVGVLVELSNRNIDKIFDYQVPSNFLDAMKVGIRVRVPFGHQILEGFVLELKNSSNSGHSLKEIISIVDADIILNKELLELGKWMQRKTLSSLISCYQVMLPKALRAKEGVVVRKKYDTFYRLGEVTTSKFNATQKQILALFEGREVVSKKEIEAISGSSLKTLERKNILIKEQKEHYRMQYDTSITEKKKLTCSQQEVVDNVLSCSSYQPFLLHGVTGSGKTEVYMELIEDALAKGKTSIVLVPEISLTPQMVERFQQRFGNRIAALHSALSEGEKYDEWRRIIRGEAQIVIGARSAIFAPLHDIGIIIVDEEHSDSYKQDDKNPRYQAKDVAIFRGQTHQCPVVFGSATPALESYARAEVGRYQLLELPNRVNGKQMPSILLVDMNQEMKKSQGHFSSSLCSHISNALARFEQIILLLNRRGYSSFVTCKNCGYTFKCPNCDITLTYHKVSRTLRCHYCGYGTKIHEVCPECKEKSLSDLGVGTEKIEEEVHGIFPQARILRMDVDTTSRKGMHGKMIRAFKNHEYDILLGTQIVAKGLDFDNVTLVGVINADTSLHIPDFRSSENTFSLLSQVAGRSGRSQKTGEVILQTFNPDHYAIQHVVNHDYLGFYKKEMQIRKMLKYPPYYYVCYVKISGRDADYIFKEAVKIKKSFQRNYQNTIILGPSPMSIFKMNNIYRYGIILKYKQEEQLENVLEKILEHYKTNRNIKIDIDFNPSHF